jgi:hypothetical protein
MQKRQSRGIAWQRASRCANAACVEVASIDGSIAVRDSKNPDGTVQMYSPSEWNAFLDGITNGDFNFPR